MESRPSAECVEEHHHLPPWLLHLNGSKNDGWMADEWMDCGRTRYNSDDDDDDDDDDENEDECFLCLPRKTSGKTSIT